MSIIAKNSLGYYLLCVEIVNLVYTLSPAANAIRVISWSDKLSYIIPAAMRSIIDTFKSPVYPDNTIPLTFAFIFGFFIGDGNFYIRIRSSASSFQFIPQWRLIQNTTVINDVMMKAIGAYLKSFGVNSFLDYSGSNTTLKVEGKDAVTLIFSMILPLNHFWFWRTSQLTVMHQLVKYFELSTKFFLEAQISMLKSLYAVSNNRQFPLAYWISIITDIHKALLDPLPSKHAYIAPYTRSGGGWVVTLPSSFGIVPRQKHFTLSTFKSLESALLAAVTYRDNQLASILKFKP